MTDTSHSCLDTSASTAEAEAKHIEGAKNLLTRIRYLKTLYMRESDLRSDLAHQKSYLMLLVGGLERNDAATRSFVADIGLSRNIAPAPKTGLARFRQAALAVRAITRMR